MLAYRIADARHTIFSGEGSRLVGGRWNPPGIAVVYAASTFAGAVLEILVHQNLGEVPRNHACVTIDIPDDLNKERCEWTPAQSKDRTATREFGKRWWIEQRSCVLLVPSVVLAGREQNILINPAHQDVTKLHVSAPEPVIWDERLFRKAK